LGWTSSYGGKTTISSATRFTFADNSVSYSADAQISEASRSHRTDVTSVLVGADVVPLGWGFGAVCDAVSDGASDGWGPVEPSADPVGVASAEVPGGSVPVAPGVSPGSVGELSRVAVWS
jgi:hypothetical protein